LARLTLGHLTASGQALAQTGQPGLAADVFECAVDTSPGDPDLLTGYASAARAAGRFAKAQTAIKSALDIEPSAKRWTVLGCIRRDVGEEGAAELAFRQALALDAEFADALGCLAECLLGQWHAPDASDDLLTEALYHAQAAVALEPENADFRATRLSILQALGDSPRVAGYASADIEAIPDCPEFYIHRGVANLRLGRLAAGFGELARSITSRERFAGNPIYSFPQWRRSTKPGEVLVWNAEGAGDLFQQARFFRLMRDEGWTVRVVCNETMSRLVGICPGVASVHDPEDDLEPETQTTPLWLAAEYLGTERDIPTPPYFGPDPETAAHWQSVIGALPRPRVGVLWRGNERQGNNQRRSFRLPDLAPVFEVPGVEFVNLQKGHGFERDAQGRNWLATAGALDLGPEYQSGDWLDTAGVLAHLDLVITPDTGLAHLAGAMGVPVWIALSEPACWRWGVGRDDSPWYPSARLVQQERRGSWDGVFERMGAELTRFVSVKERVA
jgi:Glycosyltransferase family 9 (heptosyltransferase)